MRIGEGLGTCLPNHLGVVVYTCLCLSLWGGGHVSVARSTPRASARREAVGPFDLGRWVLWPSSVNKFKWVCRQLPAAVTVAMALSCVRALVDGTAAAGRLRQLGCLGAGGVPQRMGFL